MAKKSRPKVETKVLDDLPADPQDQVVDAEPEADTDLPEESDEDHEEQSDEADSDDDADDSDAQVVDDETRAYRVQVHCPTPLAENPATVQARDQDHAWAEFCRLNGISGSEHSKQIDLVV